MKYYFIAILIILYSCDVPLADQSGELLDSASVNIRIWQLSDTLCLDQINSVVLSDAGEFYIAASSGLYVGENFSNINKINNVSDTVHLLVNHNSGMLFAGSDGIYFIDAGNQAEHIWTSNGKTVHDILSLSDTSFLFSAADSLYYYSMGNTTVINATLPKDVSEIDNLEADSYGTIFATCSKKYFLGLNKEMSEWELLRTQGYIKDFLITSDNHFILSADDAIYISETSAYSWHSVKNTNGYLLFTDNFSNIFLTRAVLSDYRAAFSLARSVNSGYDWYPYSKSIPGNVNYVIADKQNTLYAISKSDSSSNCYFVSKSIKPLSE